MEPLSSNGFGSATYWNRPTARSRAKRSTRSLSPAQRTSSPTPQIKSLTQKAPDPLRSFSSNNASQTNGKTAISSFLSAAPSSPTPSSSHPVYQSGSALQIGHWQTLFDEREKQDDKAMVKLINECPPSVLERTRLGNGLLRTQISPRPGMASQASYEYIRLFAYHICTS